MSIHEAAERLRKYSAARTPEARRDVYYGTPFILQADERTVALEYLRLTDPSPITPEALAARGFKKDNYPTCTATDYSLRLDSGDDICIRLYDADDLTPDWWINHHGVLAELTTLLQLDHLLAALTPTNKGE